MKFKILAPVVFAIGAPTVFAFPISISVTARPSSAPPTIATTIAKGVASPVTTVTTVLTGSTTPVTIVGKVAKAINSPTTFVVDTITNPTTPTTLTPSATYVPASKEDAAKNEPSAETDQSQAQPKASESNGYLMIIEEPKPIILSKDSCNEASAKTIEFVTISPMEASLKRDQATVTAVVGTMEMYPKASGKFVRHKLLNKDAFVVSFEGRWLRHRKTFRLDKNAIIYQGDKLTEVDFLRRGDPVEIAYMKSGNRYVAVAVESNRTGEYVASR
jgi:hypothetical protein